MEARAPRFSAEDKIVAIYKASGRVRRVFGTTRNISKTGVFFHADFRPQEGSAIQLVLTFPRDVTYADPSPVRCQGRVVRVESNGSNRKIGIAVQLWPPLVAAVS